MTEYYGRNGELLTLEGLIYPISGENTTISSNYGGRIHPVKGILINHVGTDFVSSTIMSETGRNTLSMLDGEVIRYGDSSTLGNFVTVKLENGTSLVYSHLNSIDQNIVLGTEVLQSTVLGVTGSTGLSTGIHTHVSWINQDATDRIIENTTKAGAQTGLSISLKGVTLNPTEFIQQASSDNTLEINLKNYTPNPNASESEAKSFVEIIAELKEQVNSESSTDQSAANESFLENIRNADKISIQNINEGRYNVQRGDTFYEIADRLIDEGLINSRQDLIDANRDNPDVDVDNLDALDIGDEINIYSDDDSNETYQKHSNINIKDYLSSQGEKDHSGIFVSEGESGEVSSFVSEDREIEVEGDSVSLNEKFIQDKEKAVAAAHFIAKKTGDIKSAVEDFFKDPAFLGEIAGVFTSGILRGDSIDDIAQNILIQNAVKLGIEIVDGVIVEPEGAELLGGDTQLGGAVKGSLVNFGISIALREANGETLHSEDYAKAAGVALVRGVQLYKQFPSVLAAQELGTKAAEAAVDAAIDAGVTQASTLNDIGQEAAKNATQKGIFDGAGAAAVISFASTAILGLSKDMNSEGYEQLAMQAAVSATISAVSTIATNAIILALGIALPGVGFVIGAIVNYLLGEAFGEALFNAFHDGWNAYEEGHQAIIDILRWKGDLLENYKELYDAAEDFVKALTIDFTGDALRGLSHLIGGARKEHTDTDAYTIRSKEDGSGYEFVIARNDGAITIADGEHEGDEVINQITNEVFGNNHLFFGGKGQDIYEGSSGNESIYGNDGNDTLRGGDNEAKEIITDEETGEETTEYKEVILGGRGNDFIDGQEGDDYISGGRGEDHLVGGAGDDAIVGDDKADGVYATYSEADDRIVSSSTIYKGGVYVATNFILRDGELLKEIVRSNSAYYGSSGSTKSFFGVREYGRERSVPSEGDVVINTHNSLADNEKVIWQNGALAKQITATDGTVTVEAISELVLFNLSSDSADVSNDIVIRDGQVVHRNLEDYVGSEDNILAGSGDDIVRGYGGNDQIDGGAGDDVLLGGQGNDRIVGGVGADQIGGGDGDDEILAGAGDDIIEGGAGDDFIEAGAGNDNIIGGAGDDVILGEMGDDVVNAGGGEDSVSGGAGSDQLFGGTGADFIYGGAGVDLVSGELGDDFLIGGLDDDLLYGGAGDDSYIFSAGDGEDSIVDSSGRDRIFLQEINSANVRLNRVAESLEISFTDLSSDKIIVEGFFDELGNINSANLPIEKLIFDNNESIDLTENISVLADDSVAFLVENPLDVDLGDISLLPEEYHDLVSKEAALVNFNVSSSWYGENFSTIYTNEKIDFDYKFYNKVQIRWRKHKTWYGKSYWRKYDHHETEVQGTAGNDLLIGNWWEENFYGKDGDDEIFGNNDDDNILGGEGNDIIYGNNGKDVINAGDGHNKIYGGQDGDQIVAGEGNDTIFGQWGNDVIDAGEGDNYVDAGSGNDRVSVGDGSNIIIGGDGSDVIVAGDGDNIIKAGRGDDSVTVGDGSNLIEAGEGADIIVAGNGDNFIDAGAGDDEITVGNGDNVILAGTGDDVVAVGDGDNEIYLGYGDDYLIVGEGNNDIYADSGDNTIILRSSVASNSSFSALFASALSAGSFMLDSEFSFGGADLSFEPLTQPLPQGERSGADEVFSHRIVTNYGDDEILVEYGDSTILSGAGDDLINLGDGTHLIDSDFGDDRVITGDGAVNADLGEGDNEITVGIGNSRIVAADGDNIVNLAGEYTAFDADYYFANYGADVLDVAYDENGDELSMGGKAKFHYDNIGSFRGNFKNAYEETLLEDGFSLRENDFSFSTTYPVGDSSLGNEERSAESSFEPLTQPSPAGGEGFLNEVILGDGDNIVYGDHNVDEVTLGDGDNILELRAGDDSVVLGNGNNEIDLGAGDDSLVVGDGDNVIIAGLGNDSVTVGDGNNEIDLGLGDDSLVVGNGDNVISYNLGDGNDEISFEPLSQSLPQGERGYNELKFEDLRVRDLSFSRTTENFIITVRSTGESIVIRNFFLNEDSNLNLVFSDGHNLSLNASEHGNDDANLIFGDAGENNIFAYGGADVVLADAGDDQIEAGADDDIIFAGAGNDRIATGSGRDFVDGGLGDDVIEFGVGNNDAIGGAGADIFTLNSFIDGENRIIDFNVAEDSLDFSSFGNEFASLEQFKLIYENSINEAGDLSLNLGDGSVILENVTDLGDLSISYNIDSLDGVVGTGGNDEITGSDLSDLIVTGGGNDVISLGAGNDVVQITKDAGKITQIRDFGTGNNRIELQGVGAIDISQLAIEQKGDDALINLAEGQKILLEGFLIENLSDESFIFESFRGVGEREQYSGNRNVGTQYNITEGSVVRENIDYLEGSELGFVGFNGDSSWDDNFAKILVTPPPATFNGYNNVFSIGAVYEYTGNFNNSDNIFNQGVDSVSRNVPDHHGGKGGSWWEYHTNFNGRATGKSGRNSDYNDVMHGANWNEVIKGRGGDDQIYGNNGNDIIWGDNGNNSGGGLRYDNRTKIWSRDNLVGNDWINGGNGHDRIYGENGHDYLIGGNGNDTIYGNAHNDTLYGENGNDRLVGGTGDDKLYGQNHNDTLYGENGNDYLYGGNNNDALYGQNGSDRLAGDAGNDHLAGGNHNDSLYGGTGNDSLYGENGNDYLAGESGNDHLAGGSHNDLLFGGEGNDALYGENHNDYLLGQDGGDLLSGGDGNDLLDGGNQADTLYGGRGNDHLIGGYDNYDNFLHGEDGHDRIEAFNGNNLIDGGKGSDTIIAGSGNDVIYGNSGNDYIEGGAGKDEIRGGAGADEIHAGEGNDEVHGWGGNDLIHGGSGNDLLKGNEGADSIFGDAGADLLIGGVGDDVLDGGAGNDLLEGEAGNDILAGGAAADLLRGGSGNDIYHYSLGDGSDVVVENVAAGSDKIVFAENISKEDLVFREDGDDLLILVKDGGSLRLVSQLATGVKIEKLEFAGGENPIYLGDAAGNSSILIADEDVSVQKFIGVSLVLENLTSPVGEVAYDSTTGLLSFAAEENYFGFSYLSYMQEGVVKNLYVVVNPVNDDPVASVVSAEVSEDSSVVIDLLAGVSDVDSDSFVIELSENSNNGEVTLENGVATYVPNSDFVGADSFIYIVRDGAGGSVTKQLNIVVNGENDAPIVVDEIISSVESGNSIVIDPRDYAFDIDGDELSVISVGEVANGVVTILADGTISYVANDGFVGNESISYVISDGTVSLTKNISLNVLAGEQELIAVTSDATVREDSTIIIDVVRDVLGSDLSNSTTSPFGDSSLENEESIFVENISRPNNGVAEVISNKIVYVPDADYAGSDVIFYTISDGQGSYATQELRIEVENVNDVPVIGNIEILGREDNSLTIDVLKNASDADGDELTVSSVSGAVHGLATIINNKIIYLPEDDFNGADSFSYVVSDGNGGEVTREVSLILSSVNDAPVAIVSNSSVDEDSTVNIDVLALASDVDGNQLQVLNVTGAENGIVSISANGVISYVPNLNFNGVENLQYTVTDGIALVQQNLFVTVNSVNDLPVLTVTESSVAEDNALVINVLAGAIDVDGDELSIDSVTQGENGIVTIEDGQIRYVANE